MLVNFPFIPESEEKAKSWIANAENLENSEELIKKYDLHNPARYIPDNLSESITGLSDNTGLYTSKLNLHYQHISLEPGYSIYSGLMLKPAIISQLVEQDEGIFEKENSLLIKDYGWVLSFADFMELIGNQLKESKRKFCVSFYSIDFDEHLPSKSGSLLHKDHSKIKLEKGMKVYHFHIFELLSDSDYEPTSEEKIDIISCAFHSDKPKDAITFIDNILDENYLKSALETFREERESW